MKHEKIAHPQDCNREYLERAEVTLLCEVRQGTRPWQTARLDDISQAGFRIAWLPGYRTDVPLRIRIPGLQVLTAHIKWAQENAVGCAFDKPLHVAVFEHIVARTRLQG